VRDQTQELELCLGCAWFTAGDQISKTVMTKSDFYNRALLAVSPVVTQAYILKHNLPFNEEPTVNDEQRLAQ
jgi:hypothetical protein